MSIIIINANLSAESSTQSLSEIVYTEIKKEDAGSSLISLHELPIPVCDGRESFGNENVKKLTDLMAKATGIVLASPIYNYTINSALKSLIEHCGSAFSNKTVGFICTAGGEKSYMSLMPTINSLMLDFRCIILPRFLYVISSNFNSDKSITDPDICNRITQFAKEMNHLTSCIRK